MALTDDLKVHADSRGALLARLRTRKAAYVFVALCAFALAACSGKTTGAQRATDMTAELHGSVTTVQADDGPGPCYAWFMYGTNPRNPSGWTATTPVGTGQTCPSMSNVDFKQKVMGLNPSTTYYYVLCGSPNGDPNTPPKAVYNSNLCVDSQGTKGVDGGTAYSSFTTSGSSYDQTVRRDSPVALWDMNSRGSTETDRTGNGHTGTYRGTHPSATTMPNGDTALDFNRGSTTGEYMSVPSPSTSDPVFSIPNSAKQLTWEAWIRPDTLAFPSNHLDSSGEYIDFLGKCQDYSPTCEWEGRMYGTSPSEHRCNRLSAYAFNSGAGLGAGADWQPDDDNTNSNSQSCPPNLFTNNNWLYVVGEYRTDSTPYSCANSSTYPGTLDIWVNGVRWNESKHNPTGCMSQYNIAPTANTSPFNVGSMGLDSWFPGAIGKVAIYDKLLTQSQINGHFVAMIGSSPSGRCDVACKVPVPTP